VPDLNRETLTVAAVQMSSGTDKEANIAAIEGSIAEAASAGANFVAVPEYATYLGPDKDFESIAEFVPGPTTQRIGALAQSLRIHVLIGSMVERGHDERLFNASVLLDPAGQLCGRYRKIHLFRAGHRDATGAEDRYISAGDRAVVAEARGWRVGMTVCYDVRFPELYRALSDLGTDLLTVPAAFTAFTGKDHWLTLLRARAIENQAYVVAPAQIGPYEGGESFGRSCIIDPWGTPLAIAGDGQRFALARCEALAVDELREQFPVLEHRQMKVSPILGSPEDASVSPSIPSVSAGRR